MPIFDAAQAYRSRGVPLILIAGRDYDAGSSRDWAAKGPALKLDGTETFDVPGLCEDLKTRAALTLRVHRAGGGVDDIPTVCRIDTDEELLYYRHGGILPCVYRELVAQI